MGLKTGVFNTPLWSTEPHEIS